MSSVTDHPVVIVLVIVASFLTITAVGVWDIVHRSYPPMDAEVAEQILRDDNEGSPFKQAADRIDYKPFWEERSSRYSLGSFTAFRSIGKWWEASEPAKALEGAGCGIRWSQVLYRVSESPVVLYTECSLEVAVLSPQDGKNAPTTSRARLGLARARLGLLLFNFPFLGTRMGVGGLPTLANMPDGTWQLHVGWYWSWELAWPFLGE